MRTDIVILNNIDFDSCSNEPLAASQGYAAYHNEEYERISNRAKLIIGFRIFRAFFSIFVMALIVVLATTMIKLMNQIKAGEIEPPLDMVQLNVIVIGLGTAIMILMLIKMTRGM